MCFFIIDYFKKEKWKYFQDVYRDYVEKPVIVKKFETLQIIDKHFDTELKKKGVKRLRIETVNKDYFNITTNDSEEKKEEEKVSEEIVENNEEKEEKEEKEEMKEDDISGNTIKDKDSDISRNNIRKSSFDDSEFIIVN